MKHYEDVNYASITESPGLKASREQVERIYQRYNFAKRLAKDKDVLEVACGSGMGLGYLAKNAKSIMGVDIDVRNVDLARKHCSGQYSEININMMDAHDLKLPNDKMDLVLFFEAIYYLTRPEKFIKEASRVLKKKGVLNICTVNKNWTDFHPSPYSQRYFSVPELHVMLKRHFADVEVRGGFNSDSNGIRDKAFSIIKRVAMGVNAIPGSLAARAHLKRIFMGKLFPLPSEVYDGMADYVEPVVIDPEKVNKDFKILYFIARK